MNLERTLLQKSEELNSSCRATSNWLGPCVRPIYRDHELLSSLLFDTVCQYRPTTIHFDAL